MTKSPEEDASEYPPAFIDKQEEAEAAFWRLKRSIKKGGHLSRFSTSPASVSRRSSMGHTDLSRSQSGVLLHSALTSRWLHFLLGPKFSVHRFPHGYWQ